MTETTIYYVEEIRRLRRQVKRWEATARDVVNQLPEGYNARAILEKELTASEEAA